MIALLVTLVNSYIKTSLDTKAIQKEHPKMCKKYIRQTVVSSSVKITLKEKEKSNE